jgi:hypothetical protein
MDLSENENALNVNESVIEKDVEGLEENENFQTKNNVVKEMKKKVYKQVLKNYMFKGEHEEGIIEMHYEHSIVSMMGNMLMGVVLKL